MATNNPLAQRVAAQTLRTLGISHVQSQRALFRFVGKNVRFRRECFGVKSLVLSTLRLKDGSGSRALCSIVFITKSPKNKVTASSARCLVCHVTVAESAAGLSKTEDFVPAALVSPAMVRNGQTKSVYPGGSYIMFPQIRNRQ